MTIFTLEEGLLFITVVLHMNDKILQLDKVLVDSGSSACMFDTLDIFKLGITFDGSEQIRKMSGIGGDEYVLEKTIDAIEIDGVLSAKWVIQLGDIQYGFGIRGVIGSDLLSNLGALLDYQTQTLKVQRRH